MATPDKPQVCHPSGFNSSLRLEENKVSANNVKDLSSLSRKTNEDGKEVASPQWYFFYNIMLQGLYKFRFISVPTVLNICDLYILLAMGNKITAKLEAKMINERKIKNHRNLRCAQQNVRMILLTTKVTTALHFLRDIEGLLPLS